MSNGTRGDSLADRGGPSVVLGLSAGFHDAAAALLVDGAIVAAVEEERLSRRKHDPSFPAAAADCCLAIAGLDATDIDVATFHEKPLGVVGRHLSSRVSAGPTALPALFGQTPHLVGRQLGVGREIARWFRRHDARVPLVAYAEHHTSHAAAAYYPSPFDSAAVLTVDGVGEWATATLGAGHGHRLWVERELRYPDSIGLLYSAFAEYCGFAVNRGEGELMGLAPFGRPIHAETIRTSLLELRDDGALHLHPRYFAYRNGRRTTARPFHELFGGPPRDLGATPTQREADLAASVQEITEEVLLSMAAEAAKVADSPNLCLAGGVALNCVANQRLATDGGFDDVWVQPAAGDAGNALGAALWVWHELLDHPRQPATDDQMSGAFLGPAFTDDEIRRWLDREKIAYTSIPTTDERDHLVADRLARGAIVGWFQGRMEFGPRALGHRSILADPRSPDVQGRINRLVKERAPFRPFAPAVLAHRADEWFDAPRPAPYMTFTAPVKRSRRVPVPDTAESTAPEIRVAGVRSDIPAVTHVDHSARIQTVEDRHNPEFAGLLEAFSERTGCPVLLNTSLNARDEPIVCTPEDAYRTFQRTGLDLLAIGTSVIENS